MLLRVFKFVCLFSCVSSRCIRMLALKRIKAVLRARWIKQPFLFFFFFLFDSSTTVDWNKREESARSQSFWTPLSAFAENRITRFAFAVRRVDGRKWASSPSLGMGIFRSRIDVSDDLRDVSLDLPAIWFYRGCEFKNKRS